MAEIVEVPNTGTRHNIFPKYKIEFGPWRGGLNTVEDPTFISVQEMAECINFVVKPDGTLNIRPSVVKFNLGAIADDYRNDVACLGSIITIANRLNPVIAISGPAATLGGTTGKIKFFHKVNGAWNTSFNDINYTGGIVPAGVTPRQILGYNNLYFLMFTKTGFATATNSAGGAGGDFATLVGPADLAGGSPTDATFLRKALIFKDRIILATDQDIYWSDTNPSGVANDWSSTAPHTAGSLGLVRELFNEYFYDMVVYNNAVYIATSSKVAKLSWSTDPGVSGDGDFTVVSDSIGGRKLEVYNGDLYLYNEGGLYRLVNNYFVEISGPIRNQIRVAARGLPDRVSMSFTGVSGQGLVNGDLTTSMFRIENLLLLGPFNSLGVVRPTDAVGLFVTGNVYFVYNLDTGVWTKWQFSPNTTDVYSMAGPCQAPLVAASASPSFAEDFTWVGLTLNDGALTSGFPQKALYTIQADDILNYTSALGYDDAGGGNHKWIGGYFKTAMVDLGDRTSWKRLQTSLMEALSNYVIPTLGTTNFGYVVEDDTTQGDKTVLMTPANISLGRLKFGKAIRARKFGFLYDSLTAVAPVTTNTVQDLNGLKRIITYMTTSRKDAASAPST